MTAAYEDKAINYEARQIWEGNVPLTIVKYRAAGLKIEQFRGFFNDPVPIQTTVNKRISGTKLEDDEGYDLYHMKVNSPAAILISHRSSFVCYYRRESEDGTLNIMNSSLGNERYQEKYKE